MLALKATCPVCDADLRLENNVEESEIIVCTDCQTRLVAGAMEGGTVPLSQAPDIEEDWGE